MNIEITQKPWLRGFFMYLYPGGVVCLREKYSCDFCQVSVMQRKSRLLAVMNSLRMRPLLFRDRVLNRASLRCC